MTEPLEPPSNASQRNVDPNHHSIRRPTTTRPADDISPVLAASCRAQDYSSVRSHPAMCCVGRGESKDLIERPARAVLLEIARI